MASFLELLHKVTDLLESEGSISYRAIKRELDVDDDVLEDIKTELVEVKQIARDIDGKVLELTSASGRVVSTAPSGKAAQETSRTITEVSDQVGPPPSEPLRGASGHVTRSAGEIQDEHKPVKKTLLIWLGAACILVGVLLPWVTSQIQMEGFGTQRGSATGLDLTQGLLSIAVGVFSAVLGFVAARRTIPAKAVALAIIVIGIVVVGVTLDVIGGVSTSDLGLPGFGGRTVMSVRQSPEPGVFVTLLGGGLLSLGGLIALIRTRKRKG